MTKSEFLGTLRRRLAGMRVREIDDVIGDYTTHFDEGAAAGRSEEEIAAALGDPMRIARELRAEVGFKRWEEDKTPSNLFAVVFSFLALIAVDFIFLLPILGSLLVFVLISATAVIGMCGAGIFLIFSPISELFTLGDQSLASGFAGLSLLSFGVGSGALLLLFGDLVVRGLGHFARLHFTLIKRANQAA